MNRCRTLLVGAVLAVPLATFGIAAESAFADEDLCGAITDDPACREGGMGFGLEDEGDPSNGFPTGCPVIPYQGQNFSNCNFSPSIVAQTAPIGAGAPGTQVVPAGAESGGTDSMTTAAAAAGAVLLVAAGVPLWIRRTRRNS